MAKKTEYTKVMTPPFRVSFPALSEPKPGPDGDVEKAKYSIRMLFDKNAKGKDAELFQKLRDTCRQVAVTFWEGKIPKELKTPLKDGDESDYAQEHGYWVMNARTTFKPGVVDERCVELKTKEEIEAKLYPGAWARATVLVGATDRAGSKCVHLILGNVQFLRDGDKFSSRKSVTEEFEPVEFAPAAGDFQGEDGF